MATELTVTSILVAWTGIYLRRQPSQSLDIVRKPNKLLRWRIIRKQFRNRTDEICSLCRYSSMVIAHSVRNFRICILVPYDFCIKLKRGKEGRKTLVLQPLHWWRKAAFISLMCRELKALYSSELIAWSYFAEILLYPYGSLESSVQRKKETSALAVSCNFFWKTTRTRILVNFQDRCIDSHDRRALS